MFCNDYLFERPLKVMAVHVMLYEGKTICGVIQCMCLYSTSCMGAHVSRVFLPLLVWMHMSYLTSMDAHVSHLCVHMCLCTCLCPYAHVSLLYAHVSAHVSICVCTYVSAHVSICVCTYDSAHVSTCMCTYVSAHVSNTGCTCVYGRRAPKKGLGV